MLKCCTLLLSNEDLVGGSLVDVERTSVEKCFFDGTYVEVVGGEPTVSAAVDSRSVGVLLGLEKERTYCILLVETRALVSDEDLFIVI